MLYHALMPLIAPRIVSLILVFLCSTSAAPAQSPPSDDALVAKVEALVADALKAPGAVGLSIAVARDDRLLLDQGYGMAEVEHGAPADAETLFRIGSVTKQFTGAAVMRLVEQGSLSLDDDLTTFLPDYPTQGHAVTIRHLLTHTSGIKSYTEIEQLMERDSAIELTHAELLAYFKDEPFAFAPGERFAYNNSGYYLLGMIIERIAGKPYAAHMQEAFFTPLGLTRTRCDSNSEIIAGRAQGYRLVNGEVVNDRHLGMSVPGAAGALLSTAGDLVRWQLALGSGKVVSPESYAQMTTPGVLSDGKPTGYGFGLVMDELDGRRRIQHGGGINGFASTLSHFPDDGVTIAIISNSEDLRGDLVRKIQRAALGVEAPEVKDLALTPDRRAPYLGDYRLADIGLDVRVFESDGALMAQATGQSAFALLFQGDHEFRAGFDNAVRLVFEPPAPPAAAPGQAGDAPPLAPSFTLHQGGARLLATRVKK